jgi:hypothetical protein
MFYNQTQHGELQGQAAYRATLFYLNQSQPFSLFIHCSDAEKLRRPSLRLEACFINGATFAQCVCLHISRDQGRHPFCPRLRPISARNGPAQQHNVCRLSVAVNQRTARHGMVGDTFTLIGAS